MAVEPRKFKSASDNSDPDEVVTAPAGSSGTAAETSTVGGSDGKSSLPLVPILAGLVGVVVLGLLIKVMTAK